MTTETGHRGSSDQPTRLFRYAVLIFRVAALWAASVNAEADAENCDLGILR